MRNETLRVKRVCLFVCLVVSGGLIGKGYCWVKQFPLRSVKFCDSDFNNTFSFLHGTFRFCLFHFVLFHFISVLVWSN